MLHIDEKYLHTISFSLRNFKKKKRNLYNCSCPICGDSKTKKTKARGYFYPNKGKNGLIFKCHNCGESMSLSTFLKKMYPDEFSQYFMERYRSSVQSKPKPKKDNSIIYESPVFEKTINLGERISGLDNDHIAKAYLLDRKIPENRMSDLYYTDDFKKLIVNLFPGRYDDLDLPDGDQRIVIPFYDTKNNLNGIQGRTLTNSKIRYLTHRIDDATQLVFGLNRYSPLRTVYVVEGPFDSLFLPNALAVATSDLLSVKKRFPSISADRIFIPDNQPRNKEIVNIVKKIIDSGEKVCLWPDFVRDKDINDMIKSGVSKEEIKNLIDNNSYSGLEAQIHFNTWKKI